MRAILQHKGVDTHDYEDQGTLFADLYAAAPDPKQLKDLTECMPKLQSTLSDANIMSFIRRNDSVAKHDHLQRCVKEA